MERTSSLGLGPTQQTGPVVSLPADPTIQEVQLNVQQHNNFHSLRADPTIQEVQLNIQQHGRKRARDDFLSSLGRGRRQTRVNFDASYAGQSKEIQSIARASMEVTQQEALSLKRENKELIAKCLEHEKVEKELSYQVIRLRKDIEEARHEYLRMLNELQSIEVVDANMSISRYRLLDAYFGFDAIIKTTQKKYGNSEALAILAEDKEMLAIRF